MKRIAAPFSVTESHQPLPFYERKPEYDHIKQERDVMVAMRDGVHICVDVYRPDAPGKFPALLAITGHNKDLQAPELCDTFGPQPAWSPFWLGAQEAGDTKFLVSRGYVHVIGNPRGFGKSEDGPPAQWDLYDLVEWIAQQSWCDSNVGMIGLSGFAKNQWDAAALQPPHLKAIFPMDAAPLYGERDRQPGGVLHVMAYLLDQLNINHIVRGRPSPLPPDQEKLWQMAMNNPDYKMYSHLYNILTQKGQHTPGLFRNLLDPYEKEENLAKAEADLDRIQIPAYTGAGWHCISYKGHLQGAQNRFMRLKVPKKLMFTGLAHFERPFHQIHSEILRWHDYWLKGINTGIMDEPPVKMWVLGANAWYYADDWPVPETQWTEFYLHSWERLRQEPFLESSRDAYDQPDAFLQMPPSQTRAIQKLRYMTDPLPEDIMVAGPSALYLYASLDQQDTNWIVILKDVGPDESVRTAREGETALSTNLPETELTRGWLKASHRALDTAKSKPWKPWHKLTREAQQLVVPGEINEYAIEVLAVANLFKRGHRICVDVTSLDIPTGTAGFTNVEYVPYHICSSKTVVHKIYHNQKYPSRLLLPIIPKENWA